MSLFFFVTNREFYYIQMEKYSRQLLSEGLVNAEDIHISADSELFRVLNLHYNRNNHIDVSYYNFFLFFLFSWRTASCDQNLHVTTWILKK